MCYEQLINSMNADTALLKAYIKGMITQDQKLTIRAKEGNPAQVESLLDHIYRWISGDEDKRLATFTAMLREMNLERIASDIEGTPTTGNNEAYQLMTTLVCVIMLVLPKGGSTGVTTPNSKATAPDRGLWEYCSFL